MNLILISIIDPSCDLEQVTDLFRLSFLNTKMHVNKVRLKQYKEGRKEGREGGRDSGKEGREDGEGRERET